MNTDLPSPLSGKHKYQIIDYDGKKGVYLAKVQDTGEYVSVRTLSRRAGREFTARFQRDAEALNSIESSHVVKIRDFGVAGEYLFIVMENLQGKSLREILDEKGPLDEIEVARIGSQLARALKDIAAHKMVHQRIRPHNILYMAGGEIKLWDFGVAQSLQFAQYTHGELPEEDAYLAPEQVDATGSTVDIRADIYAVGAVMYELLTRHTPFQADTRLQLGVKIVTTDPIPLRRYRNDILQPLEAVVSRCLAKRPEERYQNPGELLQALQATGIQEYRTREEFLFAQARKAWDNDDWKLALDLSEQLLQRAPHFSGAQDLHTQAQHRQQEEKKRNLDRLYATAIQAAQEREYDRARTICQQILRIDSTFKAAGDLIDRMERSQDRAVLIGAQDARYVVPGTGVLIGRPDSKRNIVPQVDLSREPLGNTVSRQHAHVTCIAGQWFIESLPATNTTRVGLDELQPKVRRPLADGDEIQLGGVKLVFRIVSTSSIGQAPTEERP
jgi:serine/threonine protein kinase